MRIKSEEKRQHIIDVASKLFATQGFDSASMADISSMVGGSKATIYNYFKSKEEIFVCAVQKFAEEKKQKLYECLQETDNDPRKTLETYGVRLLDLITKPEVIAVKRMIYSPTTSSELSNKFYEMGPKSSMKHVSQYLQTQMDKGAIKKGDALLAANHLCALICFNISDKTLYQLQKTFTNQELESYVNNALDLFFCKYGV